MATTTSPLPITETITPSTPAEVADAVRAAHEASHAVYPIGGGTALDYGLVPMREGRGLETTGLGKILDYTPRDMTIVVEAGVRMADLSSTLAEERQHLPIETPRAAKATVSGTVTTNWSGPRRYGYGTLRDYVIGINAVDGRGAPFKGGGRVVKNVAGYDFCKLLIGSLGTLGVVTQLTFKVKPQPEQAVTVVTDCADLAVADQVLDQLVQSPSPPAAIDLLVGTGWNDLVSAAGNTTVHVAVRFEGTESEATFMRGDLTDRMTTGGGTSIRALDPPAAERLLANQVEFSDRGVAEAGDEPPLVLKIAVVPSGVTELVSQILDLDPAATIQAHAGNGIILARFAEFNAADLTTKLVGRLRPAAIHHGGSLTVVASQFEGLTQQIVWGGRTEASDFMERIKRQFDPRGILNPGRFVF